MQSHGAVVRVFAAPMAACATGGGWASVIAAMGERLARRFGPGVTMEFVELFSARSFEFPDVLARVQRGGALPIVMIDGDVISEGGKLSEPRIVAALTDRGLFPGMTDGASA